MSQAGGDTVTTQYDADHNRVYRSVSNAGQTLYQTWYFFDSEKKQTTKTVFWNSYFMVEGGRIGEEDKPGGLAHQYFLNGLQNTIGLVVDDSDTVLQNIGYDAFGKPRYVNGSADPSCGTNQTAVTTRGYINQVTMNDLCLVDLNARYYDPALFKFLSPDPVIADPDDSQAWNAYAYSYNNPMSKSDPTGLAGDECDGGCMYATSLAYGGSSPNVGSGTGLFLHTPAGDTSITVQNALDLTGKGVYSAPQAAATQLAYIDSIAHTLSASTQVILGYQAAAAEREAGRNKQAITVPQEEGPDAAVTGAYGRLANRVIRKELDEIKAGTDLLNGDDTALRATEEPAQSATGGGGKAPDFVVSPGGTAFPVPKGATGPTPVINPAGNQTGSAFTGGSGGANGQVSTMRMMNPTPPRGASPGYPNGYIKYENPSGQGVNPYTGRTLPDSQSHFE